MWGTLSREALTTLGKDYQHLLRRGQPEPSAPVVKVETKVTGPPPTVKKETLLRQSVFKPAAQSPLKEAIDTLASDGTLGAAVGEAVPELFRSVLHTPPPSSSSSGESSNGAQKTLGGGDISKLVSSAKAETQAWKTKVVETIEKNLIPRVACEAKEWVQTWWTRERVHKVVEGVLPNRKLDALIVDGTFPPFCYHQLGITSNNFF